MTNPITKFEPGMRYSFTFIGDSDLHVCCEVLSRTAKTVRITDGHDKKTCRVSEYDGREIVKPDGSYSMCPVMSATDVTPEREPGPYRTGMGV